MLKKCVLCYTLQFLLYALLSYTFKMESTLLNQNKKMTYSRSRKIFKWYAEKFLRLSPHELRKF
jgi:hypothetical protein